MRPVRQRGCSGAEQRRRCAEFLGNVKADIVASSVSDPCVCFGRSTIDSPQAWAVAAAANAAMTSFSDGSGAGLFGVPMALSMTPPMVAWPGADDGVANDLPEATNDPQGTPLRTLEMPDSVITLQTGLMAASALQASAALIEFTLLRDPFGGFTGCVVAGLGMQAASATGFKFLPSYIVIAFANGTMKILLGLELYNYSHVMKAILGPLSLTKVAAAVVIASPLLMFAGLGIAWHLHCELRSLAMRITAGPTATATVLPAGEVAGTQQTAQAPASQQEAQPDTQAAAPAGTPTAVSSPSLPSAASRGNSFRPFSGQPMRLVVEVTQADGATSSQ